MSSTKEYFYREGQFHLVEVALVARLYEEYCVPAAEGAKLNNDSLTQTILKLKATEKKGFFHVCLHNADVVGFIWIAPEHGSQQQRADDASQFKLMALWAHPEHNQDLIKTELKRKTPPQFNQIFQ